MSRPSAFAGARVRRTGKTASLHLICVVILAACSGEDLADGFPDPPTCSSCHGTEGFSVAPPVDIEGNTTTDKIGVGAHQAHLNGGTVRKGVECSSCHVVPTSLRSPGHVDPLPAELTWGSLAQVGGAAPAWDREAATCSSVYCHGATLAGGVAKDPVWTTVDGTQLTCGSCHGDPPPAPHPQVTDCHGCHPGTVDASGGIDLDGGQHIDGLLQVAGEGCSACHGSEENAAPPVDLSGSAETTIVTVGAHQSHLHDGDLRVALACDECHTVPASVDAEGHIDAPPADLVWGALATADGAAPAWDRDHGGSCATTYCHGATLSGGTLTEPVWTVVDGTQTACGTCHGAPPPVPHPQSDACANCHPATVRANGTIDVPGRRHINGVVDVLAGDCSVCHGSPANPAPPLALDGAAAVTDPGVGAHQAHLQGGTVSGGVTCTECHVVPETADAPGHLGDPPADLTWGALATTDGAAPSYDGTANTCASTYCHGTTLTGGLRTEPQWTLVDGSQLACTSCHGFPPPLPHPANHACDGCHPGTLAGPETIDIPGGQHIDGVVQLATDCTVCHGSEAGPAPPVDLAGSADPADVGVGAHQAHLLGGELRSGIACGECHPDVTSVEGHIDGIPAELAWGALATDDGAAPAWDRATTTCSSTYCHGATLPGGSDTTPDWTIVDGTQDACGTCHGAPPPSPHPQRESCAQCHPATVRADGTIDVAGGQHIDGEVDLAAAGCTACHGSEAGGPAPPLDLAGSADTAAIGVGAHESHLQDGDIRAAVACTECHVVPATLTAPGHLDALPADLTWGALATTDGVEPAWDRATATCASTYCHGATLGGGGNKTPIWTVVDGTQAGCGQCHGFPPPAPHPQVFQCSACHPETVRPDGSIDIAGGHHIDGVVDAPTLGGCSDCHGSPASPAPPVDLAGSSDTADVTVGAHQAHLGGGTLRAGIACTECHLFPAAIDAPGHIDQPPADLVWGALADGSGALTPAWDRGAASCATTYCHGATLSGGTNKEPVWTVLDGTQDACGTCHGAPPPLPHPQNAACDGCHPATVLADGTIDVAGGHHIDGVIDVPALSCSACHGSEANAAPPVDLAGSEDEGDVTVGAHQRHLLGGALRAGLACDECHVVPAAMGDAGHLDPAPAELTWGALADSDGALAPEWDRAAATCATTYCHGTTLSGGSNTEPVWTVTDGSQAACGTCHGTPPPAPHTQSGGCSGCHAPTVLADGTIDVAGGQHVDGDLDVGGVTCTSCHGSPTSPAPPVDVAGSSDTADVTVGAHQAHLRGGTLRRAIGCTECHVLPPSVGAPGHMDGPPAELTWGSLASAAGALTPGWDRAAATCATTYCHGATLSGGTNTAPTWTVVDGSQDACGTCHGAPPPLPHPPNGACSGCHPATVLADGTIDVAGGRHINGVLDVPALSCSACHGSEANAAPPVDLAGSSDPADVTVGAHQRHLLGGALRAGLACDECHVVPAAVGDAGHMDASPAELTWGALADGAGALLPEWDRGAGTCATTYCHGATLDGGSNTEPTWTVTDGSQAACGTCHGAPPPLPHVQSGACDNCHPETVRADGTIDVAGGHHIDGVVDAPALSCSACHGSETNAAPPVDLAGSEDEGDVTVGAHQRHLLGGALRAGVACDECHTVPATVDAAGHVDASPAELSWGALADDAGALLPEWDRVAATCATTYCHGATLAGGSNTAPTWTVTDGSQAACGTCHGAPPPLPHPQSGACNNCHPETVQSDGTIDVAGGHHIDGVLDAPAAGCSACHGNETNAAPPVDLAGSEDEGDVTVGAHQRHLLGGALRAGVACDECHVVPAAVGDAGHVDAAPAELSWGVLADGAGALTPEWDRGAETCATTYCHGATLDGGSNTAPTWTVTDGSQAACGTCHGAPPPLPHPQVAACNGCHPETVLPDGTIDVAGGHHIDGVLDAPAAGCSACHGSEANAAPPVDLAGSENEGDVTVGAHQRHLLGGALRAGVACDECHVVPAAVGDAGHMDTAPAELNWGALADDDGTLAPEWDRGAETCATTYCHGATLGGGSNTEPTWTVTDGSQAACGTCHGTPPPAPHPGASQCAGCHPLTVLPGGTIDVAGGYHIDGALQVHAQGACDGCHDAPPDTGAHRVHFAAGVGDPSYGGTGVVGDGTTGYGFDCGLCHPTAGARHGDGAENAGGGDAEIALSPTGAPPSSLKRLNPATASYAPGPTVYTDARGYRYTVGTCSDVYCHSRKEVAAPGPVLEPFYEFPYEGRPIVYPPYEVQTWREYGAVSWGDSLSCDGCHGFPPRTFADTVAAGVGDSHSWIDAEGAENFHTFAHAWPWTPMACADCHQATVTDPGERYRGDAPPAEPWTVYEPVPIAGFGAHVDGAPDVAFTSDLVWLKPEPWGGEGWDLSGATWDPATHTCSNVSCHLEQTSVQWGLPYRWRNDYECDSCHRFIDP